MKIFFKSIKEPGYDTFCAGACNNEELPTFDDDDSNEGGALLVPVVEETESMLTFCLNVFFT